MKTNIRYSFRNLFVLCNLLSYCGCANEVHTPTDPVTFVERRAQKVVQGSNRVTHSFRFQVWNKTPVIIKSVTASCSCTKLEEEIEGKPLEPGSSHEVTMNVNPEGRSGKFEAMLIVETDPPTREPILLTTELLIVSLPVASPNPLIIKTLAGAAIEAKVNVIRVREVSISPLKLLKEKSNFGPFELIDFKVDHGEFITSTDASQVKLGVRDELTLNLNSKKTFGIGDHPFEISLKWENTSEPTRVPGSVQVLHPSRPELTRVFDQLQSKERKRFEVLLFSRDVNPHKVASVSCDLSCVKVEMNQSGDGLVYTIQAPSNPGKLGGTTLVRFENETFLPLSIPTALLIVPD